MARVVPYKARGRASWYGKRYHGQPTASGEPYDMYAMTAAHPTLPIPSYARVTNLRNGKAVIVRINDRGPFRGDRLIDLSYTAAYQLGIVGSGSDLVEVESIVPGELCRGRSRGAVCFRSRRCADPSDLSQARSRPRRRPRNRSGDAAPKPVAAEPYSLNGAEPQGRATGT